MDKILETWQKVRPLLLDLEDAVALEYGDLYLGVSEQHCDIMDFLCSLGFSIEDIFTYPPRKDYAWDKGIV